MASINDGGVRIFEGSSREVLEAKVNAFLLGDSTTQDPKKFILYAPSFFVDGGVFYVFIVYQTIN